MVGCGAKHCMEIDMELHTYCFTMIVMLNTDKGRTHDVSLTVSKEKKADDSYDLMSMYDQRPRR